jgi:hypothetical protein
MPECLRTGTGDDYCFTPMKTTLLSLMLLILPVCALHARIGETEKQIEARYGPQVLGRSPYAKDADPKDIATQNAMADLNAPPKIHIRQYCLNEIAISVTYLDGMSEGESYRSQKSFDETETKFLLKETFPDAEIKPAADPGGNGWDIVKNSVIIARAKNNGGSLDVVSTKLSKYFADYSAAIENEREKKKMENLKGF